MKKLLYIPCFIFASFFSEAQNTTIVSETEEPVSYATISFGNGNGLFADDAGQFYFTKKLYKDIDSLFISAIGFNDLKVATQDLSAIIKMKSSINTLDEVFLSKPRGKFKIEKIKPTVHEDYYKCWLPTIESEIAVYFPNNSTKTQRLSSLQVPIKVEAKDWDKRKRKTSKKRPFSTVFKVNFYENNNGLPGHVLTYENVVFIANEKNEKILEVNVTEYDIYMPKNGIFVSLQVLGYTDAKGKLLPNKKYQEIKTKRGIVKVPTTFRPLLPFTDEIAEKRTFVRRIFLNGGQWTLFDKQNVEKSNLLKAGLNNYGLGLNLEVYKED
ncbi:carboxypeptidase-like regulatory domain-containing protein [Lacinutrix sp. Bg11-31]|uniref:carboxypeptidase-like regulatory domain-containing protein n=1 Tax=Lacinutrix sp. Bg11-31 TaxID=2057808 RepID=UPI001E31B8FD|nr:carboxypeptidase-like regulatory domain-containing protein [Lacinutrix sp. Bg11-31]